MSSKKSVRQLLDKSESRSKSKTNLKSSSNSSLKSSSNSSLKSRSNSNSAVKEVIPKLVDKLPSVNMSALLKGRSTEKRPVSFSVASTLLPAGARIAYVLYQLYEDRRTGEKKYVYSNSAFYQGTIEMKSYSVIEKKELITPKMVVKVGKNTYYLTEEDVKELYVFTNQTGFKDTPKERCMKQLRSKSLEHVKTERPNNRAKSLLH